MRLKVVDQELEMLRVPLVRILAQDMQLKTFSTILGDGASAASYNIGAKFAIERKLMIKP